METLSSPIKEPPPAELVAEAELMQAQVEAMRELAASQLGREAMIQAGMPEFLIEDPESQGMPPMTFIEHGVARIALGGF